MAELHEIKRGAHGPDGYLKTAFGSHSDNIGT
jgi:hypothetical protein